jgi:hypothetical protein
MSSPSCPTADFSRPPCYPARLTAPATPCPRTPHRRPNGIPRAGAVGPWFTRAVRRQDVSLKTPASKPPHGPIACAPSPVGMFHSVAQDRAAYACAAPFPHPPHPHNATRISVAQCFTSPANPWKTTDLPGHGLCNTHNADVSQGCAGRPLPQIRACATVPAAMVRHVSQKAATAGSCTGMIRARPMKHRRAACFTAPAWAHPGPEPDAGDRGGGCLDSGRVSA